MQVVRTKKGYYVYRDSKLLGRRVRVAPVLLTKRQVKGVKQRVKRKKQSGRKRRK